MRWCQARRAGVRIYKFNINFDHIHLLIKLRDRRSYFRFIRAVTGLISRKLGRGLWKLRPFTPVAHWGRAFRTLKKYIQQNELEVNGLIPYQPRKRSRYKTAPP